MAVFLGFLTVVVLSVVTDKVLETSTSMLAVALAYRSVYTVIGGYVTAALAPDRPMHHVKILAWIGLAAGIAGVFFGWDLSQHWYPIALAVTGPLFTLLGGKLKK